METKITNIVLDKDRFTVFAKILGNEEINTFMPEVTAQDIRNWISERVAYYQSLHEKEEELKDELMNIEL